MFSFEQPPEAKAGVADLDCSDATILVTGSTSGIGRAAALSFARLGATVIVHGRDEVAAAAVLEAIEETPGAGEFIPADFADPAAVDELATTIRDEYESLDVLCNNAGGFFSDRKRTDLGVDRTFHINHLAPYQLTAQLLPLLEAGSRVVTTASVAHRGTTLSFDQLLELAGQSPMAAYARSKLANILFSNELARRLENAGRDVTSNAFHPGVIPGSEFSRSFPGITGEFWQLFEASPFLESVEDGAATLVYLGVSPDVAAVTGSYFARCREIRPSSEARDETRQQELWERSAKRLDMEEPLAEVGV